MKTPVISFYSDVDGRTYYSDHAIRLSKNLNEFQISHYIREKKSLGSYRLNCLSKPRFILEMMNELRTPLIWLDVDSIVHQQLKVFDEFSEKVDLAFACQSLPTATNPTISLPKASPIYLNQTEKAYSFIYDWIEKSEFMANNSNLNFDHEILMHIFTEMIQNNNSNCRIAFLNNGYCIWPGSSYEGEKYITMGLADVDSKKTSLKDMGISDEGIDFQSPGNKFLVNL